MQIQILLLVCLQTFLLANGGTVDIIGSYDKKCITECMEYVSWFRGEYSFCYTKDSWDCCSVIKGVGSFGSPCTSACGVSWSTSYKWCRTGWFSWDYCSTYVPAVDAFLTYNRYICSGDCVKAWFPLYGTFHYCEDKGRSAYCSRHHGVSYRGNQCDKDHWCGKHGKDYYWCKVNGEEEYCSPIKDCSYGPLPLTIETCRARRDVINVVRKQNLSISLCRDKICNGTKINSTTTLDWKVQNANLDDHNNAELGELHRLMAQFNERQIPSNANSRTINRTPNFRTDLQGTFIGGSDGIRYANIQIQRNGQRRPGRPTSVAMITLPTNTDMITPRFIRRALSMSLQSHIGVNMRFSRSSLSSGLVSPNKISRRIPGQLTTSSGQENSTIIPVLTKD